MASALNQIESVFSEIRNEQKLEWGLVGITEMKLRRDFVLKSEKIVFEKAGVIWWIEIQVMPESEPGSIYVYGSKLRFYFHVQDDGVDENAHYSFLITTNTGGVLKTKLPIKNSTKTPQVLSMMAQMDLVAPSSNEEITIEATIQHQTVAIVTKSISPVEQRVDLVSSPNNEKMTIEAPVQHQNLEAVTKPTAPVEQTVDLVSPPNNEKVETNAKLQHQPVEIVAKSIPPVEKITDEIAQMQQEFRREHAFRLTQPLQTAQNLLQLSSPSSPAVSTIVFSDDGSSSSRSSIADDCIIWCEPSECSYPIPSRYCYSGKPELVKRISDLHLVEMKKVANASAQMLVGMAEVIV